MSVDGGAESGAGPCAPGDWESLLTLPVDRTCDSDTDCTMATLPARCCGDAYYRGLRTSDLARYQTAVSECAASIATSHCWMCPSRTDADDGTFAPGIGSAPVELHCVAHVCTTTVVGSTLCGTGACAPGYFCGHWCEGYADGGLGPAMPHCVFGASCDAGGYCECASGGGRAACNGGTCSDVADGGYSCACP